MSSAARDSQTKFCRIYRRIEQKNSLFAEALRDLCLEGMLAPGAKYNGITFLYPPEKKIKDFIKMAYCDDAEKAIELLQTYVLPVAVNSSKEFINGKVGNLKKIRINTNATADGEKVTLSNGCVLEKDIKFQTLYGKGSLSVWNVISGDVPTDGESYMPEFKKMARKGGGFFNWGNSKRIEILNFVKDKLSQNINSDPFIDILVSFINHLKLRDNNTLDMIKPLFDYEAIISFFIIFEPYKKCGPYIIDDHVLESWKYDKPEHAPASFYIKYISREIYDKNKLIELIKKIDDVRPNINSTNLCTKIYNIYNNYYTIGSQIYTKEFIEKIPPNKKLWQDVFRFIVSSSIYALRGQKNTSIANYENIFKEIKELYPGNDYTKELIICRNLSSKNIEYMRDIMMTRKFMSSTDFLYITLPDTIACRIIGDADVKKTALVYNRTYDSYLRVYNISKTENKKHGGEKIISENTLDEIERYIKTNGEMPARLKRLLNQN